MAVKKRIVFHFLVAQLKNPLYFCSPFRKKSRKKGLGEGERGEGKQQAINGP